MPNIPISPTPFINDHAALQTGVHGISIASGKTLTVSDSLTLATNQTAEGTVLQIATYQPKTAGFEPFQFQFQSFANSGSGAGTYNHGAFFGFNSSIHAGSTGWITGKPSILLGFEDNYFDNVSDNSYGVEAYIEYVSPDGVSQTLRPFYARMKADNNTANRAQIILNMGTDGNGSLSVNGSIGPTFVVYDSYNWTTNNIKVATGRGLVAEDIINMGANAAYVVSWKPYVNGAGVTFRVGNDATPLKLTYDAGLTAGVAFTPTQIFKVNTNGAISAGVGGRTITDTGFLINLVGDNIFSLADATTQMFSIRTQKAGGRIVINAANSYRLALGVDTGTSEGSLTEHLTIDSGGSVGIGLAALASPGGKVEILGNNYATALIVSDSATQGATTTPVATFNRLDAIAGVSAMLGLTALGSGADGDGGSILLNGKSSTTAAQSVVEIDWLWASATHASRKAQAKFMVYDTAAREAIRIEASGTAAMLGLFGHAAAIQPTTASFGVWSTLANVVTALQSLGILGV